MITLCLDFGNTRLKAGIFENADFVEEVYLTGAGVMEIKLLLEKYRPVKCILSSVINHDEQIESLLSAETIFHKLSSTTRLNFTNPVSKPETIGADRLALIAAAVHFFPGKNNLVISLGTCITYNFVNQYHQFLGGSISPGMDMRFKSMHEFTAKLPLATNAWHVPLIGYDTKTNLQSGVVTGITSELAGFIGKYNEAYGNFNAVLTGGNSAYFAGQVKNRIFADHNFLFKGLYALSELNNCPA